MIDIDVNDLESQVKALIDSFAKLPNEVSKKYMRSGLKKPAAEFEDVLRANTPAVSGSLMRSIVSKVKVYDKGTHQNVSAVVGYKRGTLKKKKGMFLVTGSGQHALLVEDGTKGRYTKSGRFTGQSPARRMMFKTFNARKAAVLQNIADGMAKGLEKAAKKLAKTQSGGG